LLHPANGHCTTEFPSQHFFRPGLAAASPALSTSEAQSGRSTPRDNQRTCDSHHSWRLRTKPWSARCGRKRRRESFEGGPMMTYTFDPSPIYSAGEVASAWFVAVAFFALLAFAW